jgi:hypothetical protein
MLSLLGILDNGAGYSATSALLIQNPGTASELWWNGSAFVPAGSLTIGQAYTSGGTAIIAGVQNTLSGGSWNGRWLFVAPSGIDQTQSYKFLIFAGAVPVEQEQIGEYSWNGILFDLYSLLQYVSGSSGPMQFTAIALANAPSGGGGSGGATAAQVWSYTTRTLTGTSGAIGPTAGANLAPIPASVVPNQSVDLSAAVYESGQLPTQSGTSTIVYTIWDVEQDQAVPGQSAVSLTVASVLSNTLLSDAEATNYNFRFTPAIGLGQPFPHQGRFNVAVTFAPTSGQAYYCNFEVWAKW